MSALQPHGQKLATDAIPAAVTFGAVFGTYLNYVSVFVTILVGVAALWYYALVIRQIYRDEKKH